MADMPAYQVLARKYRPQNFADLIGQEAMVRTLTNAFAAGRIAHAFMLTGVRGVGKTTTARLLARALNYEADRAAGAASTDGDGPRLDLVQPGVHCAAIAASNHPDIMEMDAASRTGVGDIREILESVRYAPVSARFKVYVIDEVHMLSTSAFNALLKTLEEPPAHVKFIFATTEIRKVPVTVLSRCQRFDLRRVEADRLVAHLGGIAQKEGAEVDADALRLIARASEGSVRDALSLLDQAIVQGGAVGVDAVRAMLGLADRTQSFELFARLTAGNGAAALALLDELYAAGADAVTAVRDLLDHCHDVTRAKALGEGAQFAEASDQIARIRSLAEATSMGGLARTWQMLLKAHEEARAAPDAQAAVEMAVLRIAHAASLPPPEDAARLLLAAGSGGDAGARTAGAGATGDGAGGGGATGRAKSAPQVGVSGDHGASEGPRARAPVRLAAVSTRPGDAAARRLDTFEPDAEMAPAPVNDPALDEGRAAPFAPPQPDAATQAKPGFADVEPAYDGSAYDHDGGPDDDAPPLDVYEGRAEPDAPHLSAEMPGDLAAIGDLARTRRDLMLWYDVGRFVRPVHVAPGRLEFQAVSEAPADLAQRLARKLQEWTGERWLVSAQSGRENGGREPGETLFEIRARQEAALRAEIVGTPGVAAVLAAWPDAQILNIRARARPQDSEPETLP